jgi:hypothetical protein
MLLPFEHDFAGIDGLRQTQGAFLREVAFLFEAQPVIFAGRKRLELKSLRRSVTVSSTLPLSVWVSVTFTPSAGSPGLSERTASPAIKGSADRYTGRGAWSQFGIQIFHTALPGGEVFRDIAVRIVHVAEMQGLGRAGFHAADRLLAGIQQCAQSVHFWGTPSASFQ